MSIDYPPLFSSIDTLEARTLQQSKVEEDLQEKLTKSRKELAAKNEVNANLLEQLSNADLEKTKLKQKLKRKIKKLRERMRGGSNCDKGDDEERNGDEDERESR